MSEAGKTLVYLAVAGVLAGGAFLTRPRQEAVTSAPQTNKPIFQDFPDPNKLQGMRIVRYDEELGEIHNFEVAKNTRTGLWTIPSHSDYPADADDRLRDAANLFVELKILGVVTDDASEHSLFGVLEPNKDKVKLGDKGVGTLIRFDAEKTSYALIVGKKIKGAEDHRFVRITGQDRVYDVKLDPDKLSTKFEDWIKKDLLDLSAWDIERVKIKDYSIVQAMQGAFLEPRLEVAVSFNSTDSKWNLDEFLTYRGKEKTPTKLSDTEELNKQKLDDLKTALDDLSIVDVRRKPKGLGANLRAGTDFMNDAESRESLRSRGFYPNPVENGQFEILAANGEVHAGMKDGVEYVLRFGNVAETSEVAKDGKLNRYLLLTAQVDDSKLPIPTPPPGLDPAKAAEVKAAAENAATAKPEAKPAAKVEPAPAAPAAPTPPAAPVAPAEKQPEPKKSESGALDPQEFVPVALLENAADTAAAAAKPEPSPAPAAAPAAEKPAVETPPAAKVEPAPKADASAKPPAPADTPPAPPAADTAKPEAKAETAPAQKTAEMGESDREKLAKDYQRQLDEWNDKKKKANNKVRELNARFAEWYYVISEDSYKKIHLGRGDLIKESEKAKEEGFGADAFRDLQSKGVEKKPTDTSSPDAGVMQPPMPPMP